jgi:hypothetical protein
MYEMTAKRHDLTPEEVQILVDFKKSPEGELWERLERHALTQANWDLEHSTELHTILRAQGQKLFYRRREEVLFNIVETARLEKEGLYEPTDE